MAIVVRTVSINAAFLQEIKDDHHELRQLLHHTAAMLAPYANRPDTSGRAYYEPSEFDELIARLDARGLQCFVHATGDRGNRLVLDAFEHAQRVNGRRDSRHQVVHVECLDAADVPRFGELGVVACMQPRHCAPEIVREWRANVGERRWRHAWRRDCARAIPAAASRWRSRRDSWRPRTPGCSTSC